MPSGPGQMMGALGPVEALARNASAMLRESLVFFPTPVSQFLPRHA